MTRWKAAAIHLSISVLIGLAAAALIFGVWYPRPYSQAAGAGELVLLLLGVDIVLGPLLTFVVFKSGKKGMKFDLAVIGVLQACAFLYGASIVVRARPAFVVTAVDRFMLVAANDLDPADLAKAKLSEFQTIPWTGPRLVGTELPTDPSARNKMLLNGIAGKDVEKFPEYYVDYAKVAQDILAHGKPLDVLRKKHPEATSILDVWLRDHQRDPATLRWLPLMTHRMNLIMILDHSTGQVLDALPIDPW